MDEQGQAEVIRLRMRYIIELDQTPDDRVEGILPCDGLPAAVPFSGSTEFLSLLESPPLAECEPVPGPGQHQAN
jgi:hypothetical protein